jgi:phage terminase large subunit-like protein
MGGPLVTRAAAADRAVFAINQLTHTKGPFAGQPFHLRPWQVKIVRKLFTTGPDGRRVYRQALLMLPRKNGKTELCAALAIYFLLFDGEIGGEVYSAAADKEQAALVFHVAAQMIRNDPILEAACEIVESQKRIVHPKSGSFYRAISAEAYSKHGFNASVVIYDELHAAPNRELWDVLTTSQGARAQPITIAISTAGFDRHSILWELYTHGVKVREDPALDPTFLPILYEAPTDADWTSEKVWRKANPALGDFRSLEEMRTACKRAQEIPAQENTFRRLYLNQWTEQEARWISLSSWDSCAAPARPLERRPCYVGMDLSSTKDLTALAAVFPDPDGGGFDVLTRFFIPADSIRERSNRDRVPFDLWAKQGHVDATPGNVVDYEAVRATLGAWAARYDIKEIAYDPWNATDLVTRLQEQDGFTCVPMRQGFVSLSAPTKALEKAVLSRTIRHDGHPVLRWNVSNVSVETDATGNLKPSKKVSTDRIDGVVALIMAIDRMDRNNAIRPTTVQMLFMGS